MTILHAALVQQRWSGDVESMTAASEARIREAVVGGARLVILQELHRGPYFCQVEDPSLHDLAEAIPGPSTERFGRLAAELDAVLVLSLFERRAPGLSHNTAVVIDADGSLAGIYRKMHIPDDPGFYEKFFFAPGDLGFHPIATAVGRLGVLVCWDQWYPEAARLMALAGAELLIYPTAIGADPRDPPEEQERQREAWTTVQRGHAVANGLPVLVANRVGHEEDPGGTSAGIAFWGSSFAVGPQGEFLARAGSGDEEILAVAIDRERTEQVRRIWPFFRDRRIDAYQGLLQRWGAPPPT